VGSRHSRKACASSDSLEQWPLSYRRGLVDGLFFDETGKARTAAWAVDLVPDILRPTENQAGELDRLLLLLGSERFSRDSDDYTLWSTAKSLTAQFDPAVRPAWEQIAARCLPDPPF
jgi:hypothetical protein